MKTLAIYALEVLACSGVLLAAYAILLERRVKFRWCRLYLLAATAMAALIPLLRIPVWPGKVIVATPVVTAPDIPDWTAEVLPDAGTPAVTPGHLCLAVYLLGAALILGVMLWQILRIRLLQRGAEITRTGRCKIVRTRQEIASFSFFRTIYIWARTPAGELDAIMAHESSHIAHRHSVERILMEVLKAALWWNPFAWIAARRLTEAEEFEADSDVLSSGFDRAEYMQTIFRQLFGYSPEIANGLRNSLTKKRFKMMTTQTKGRYNLLRLAGTLPAMIGLLCAFSFTTRAAVIVLPESGTGIENAPEQQPAAAPAEDLKKDKTCKVTINVRNKDNAAIPGALVQVAGTTQGVVTDAEGHAGITVPVGSRLTVSYPDYEPETVTAGKEGEVEVLLTQNPTKVTEKAGETATYTKVHVIVSKDGKPLPGALVTIKGTSKGIATDAVGYGEIDVRTKSVLEVTYVGCKPQVLKVDKSPRQTFTVNLRADTPGISAGSAGKPLWIIDGIEVTPDLINKIDPNQIENMMILKDQSAMATYGERARDGVIIITTKDGRIAPAISGTAGTNGNETITVQAERQDGSIRQTGDKGTDEPFLIAETMPMFPMQEGDNPGYGDLNSFRKWVQNNVKYPAEAMKADIQGRVVLSFVVEKDGSVSNMQVLQTPDKLLSAEALRVVAASPKWKPGEQRGEKVRVKYTLPVDFRMTRDKDTTEAEEPFVVVETPPQFNGGDIQEFRKWIQMHVKYPEEALRKRAYGKVLATFVIEKDGSVSNVGIFRSPDESLAEEVRRVIESAPKWTPGKQRGEAVRVKFVVPIDFAISTEKQGVLRDKTPQEQGEGTLDEIVVVGYGTRQQ